MTRADATLTAASLLTALLVTVHLAGDIVRHADAGGLTSLAVLVVVVTIWLYGTTILAGRTSGYVIMILMSVVGLLIPVVHMKGAGVAATLGRSDGDFLFVWSLLALGAGAAFTLLLAVRGLWGLRRGAPRGMAQHP